MEKIILAKEDEEVFRKFINTITKLSNTVKHETNSKTSNQDGYKVVSKSSLVAETATESLSDTDEFY